MTNARDLVLLLHGLWMNRFTMLPLASALEAEGFDTVSLGYRSMMSSPQENLARLAARLDAMAARRIHVVGHSMGGVFALALLQHRANAARAGTAQIPGRIVLLGSPVAGCEAARVVSTHAGGRWLLGKTMPLWESLPVLSLPAGCEVGAIAGTRRIGLAHMLVHLAGEHDGVVRLEETRMPGLADHRVLPVSHFGMLVSREVARQCAAFLRNGKFSP